MISRRRTVTATVPPPAGGLDLPEPCDFPQLREIVPVGVIDKSYCPRRVMRARHIQFD